MNDRVGRYVVLHHTGHGPDHFDLMLAVDDDGPLLTWRCAAWPVLDGSACEPLPPHRRAYLTYEGDVSGGRGRVRRVAGGTFERAGDDGEAVSVRIDGVMLRLRHCHA